MDLTKLSKDDDNRCIVCFNKNINKLHRLYCKECNSCIICKKCYESYINNKNSICCPKCRKQISFKLSVKYLFIEKLIKIILLTLLSYVTFVKYLQHVINDHTMIIEPWEFFIWIALILYLLMLTSKLFIHAIWNPSSTFIFNKIEIKYYSLYNFLVEFVNLTMTYFISFEIINFIQEIIINNAYHLITIFSENHEFFWSLFRIYSFIFYDFVVMNYGTTLMIFILRSKLLALCSINLDKLKYPTIGSLIKLKN